MEKEMKDFLLFAGIKGDPFPGMVARELGVELSRVKHTRFQGATPTGGETKQQLEQNVMDRQCFIVWSVRETNDEIWQIIQLIDALVNAGAKGVHLVVPCYPYARQDKRHGNRECISASLLARLLETVHLNTICYIDIHADQIEGFFRYPTRVKSLWMDSIWLDYLARKFYAMEKHFDSQVRKTKMMALDEGSVRINYRLAERLGKSLAVHLKSRNYSKDHEIMSLGIAGRVDACILAARDDIIA